MRPFSQLLFRLVSETGMIWDYIDNVEESFKKPIKETLKISVLVELSYFCFT